MNLNSERMNEVAKLESAASKIFINEIIFTFLLQSAMREPFKTNQFIEKKHLTRSIQLCGVYQCVHKFRNWGT